MRNNTWFGVWAAASTTFGLAGCDTFSQAGADAPRPVPTTGVALEPDAVIDTIVFGSCAREDRDQPIWESIVAAEPDVFLFIGDNVYVDIPDVPGKSEDFARSYADLAAKPGWQELTATTPVLATWDDHDYGLNDAGREWEMKDVAKDYFMDFYGIADDAPMRTQHDGIYHAHTVGPDGKRVQFIMLDTRTFRDPLDRHPKGREEIDGHRYGPYTQSTDTSRTLLGEAQWAWLEEQLAQPADVRIIASSIQVVTYEHRWECWGNLPHERQRLFDLIQDTQANGVVFISGDRHLIEISKSDEPDVPYPMWDFTSSGFNWGDRPVSDPNRFRVGPVLRQPNFGVIRIDWDAPSPTVWLEGRDGHGDKLMGSGISLATLAVE
ncbi:MAG: alkaline phosphatase D family protein [Planctomycetota bacterium]